MIDILTKEEREGLRSDLMIIANGDWDVVMTEEEWSLLRALDTIDALEAERDELRDFVGATCPACKNTVSAPCQDGRERYECDHPNPGPYDDFYYSHTEWEIECGCGQKIALTTAVLESEGGKS